MPTFVLEHRGEEKARIRGANAVELEAKINEVLPSVSSAVSVGSDSSLVPGMVRFLQRNGLFDKAFTAGMVHSSVISVLVYEN